MTARPSTASSSTSTGSPACDPPRRPLHALPGGHSTSTSRRCRARDRCARSRSSGRTTAWLLQLPARETEDSACSPSATVESGVWSVAGGRPAGAPIGSVTIRFEDGAETAGCARPGLVRLRRRPRPTCGQGTGPSGSMSVAPTGARSAGSRCSPAASGRCHSGTEKSTSRRAALRARTRACPAPSDPP